MARNKIVKKGKWWFRLLKRLMTVKYKKPTYVYLDGEFPDGSLILSNHEGTDAPMALEMYMDKKLCWWGAYEMNSGLKELYKYQTRVYYHEKKHWNLFLARLFCLIASPLTNLFYKGMNVISTYKDTRFIKTIKESLGKINEGYSIVVYPEDSSNGYLKELEGFYKGFAVFAEACKRKGVDLPVVVSYYNKFNRVYIFDKPILYSELLAKYGDNEKIVQKLLERCNELGKISYSEKND